MNSNPMRSEKATGRVFYVNRGQKAAPVRCLRCCSLKAQSDYGDPFPIFRCPDCGYAWTPWESSEWLSL